MATIIQLTEETKAEINEHISALMELAQIHQIPLFFTMVTESDDEKTEYEKGILSAQSAGIELKTDTIRKHLLVEAGYDLIPPRENITVNMEAFVNGE